MYLLLYVKLVYIFFLKYITSFNAEKICYYIQNLASQINLFCLKDFFLNIYFTEIQIQKYWWKNVIHIYIYIYIYIYILYISSFTQN